MEYARVNMEAYPFYVNAIDGFFQEVGTEMFLNFTVRDCTFDGIDDPLISGALDSPIPLPIPFDRFGWFYPRNGSLDYDGTFSMFTGANSISEVGQIAEWNYKNEIDPAIYPSYCGQLNGSAGEFFPPGRGKDYVDFFTPDLCRQVKYFQMSTKFEHGVLEGTSSKKNRFQHTVPTEPKNGFKWTQNAE